MVRASVLKETESRLANQVRSNYAEEFVGGDDLGLLPEFWKVLLIARQQKVGARSVGAFQELVVVRVLGKLRKAGRRDRVRIARDEINDLTLAALTDLQFRAGENINVFEEDGVGVVQGS